MKMKFLLIAMITVCSAAMAQASTVYGDVNGDGTVNASDVTALYDYFLNGDMTHYANCDVDGDGNITSYDITEVYNILLGYGPSVDTHEYVDLGLPSGTLWATMNIGAETPEDYGDYFAWGETTPKDVYKWDNYQWSNGTRFNKLIKYCTNSSYGYNGFVDDKTELEPEDDAATANWGSHWCMPTEEQLDELIAECNWHWTTRNGINGNLVTSKHNGASIFLPAGGYHFGDQLYSTGTIAYYWSRIVNASKSYQAYYLWFHSQVNLERSDGDLDSGFSVRAVRVSQK